MIIIESNMDNDFRQKRKRRELLTLTYDEFSRGLESYHHLFNIKDDDIAINIIQLIEENTNVARFESDDIDQDEIQTMIRNKCLDIVSGGGGDDDQ